MKWIVCLWASQVGKLHSFGQKGSSMMHYVWVKIIYLISLLIVHVAEIHFTYTVQAFQV